MRDRRPSLLPVWLLLAALAACAPAGARSTTNTAAPAALSGAADEGWSVPSLPPLQPVAPAEYARRRAALAAQMQDGVLVVWGAPEPEADYLTFAQSPPLRYLTGIAEPGAALVVAKTGADVRARLFVRPRSPAREVWEGARLGAEAAQARTGIAARDVGTLAVVVDSLLPSGGTLYTLWAGAPDAHGGSAGVLSREAQLAGGLARRAGARLAPLDAALLRLRALKSPAERDRIRRAAYITALAQRAALRAWQPGMNEFEVQGLVEYVFRRHGAERPSFATIIGSGPNSTTLHYQANNRFSQPDEVVVMDVGASYDGYAADVTRTVPVSGRFSPEQRAVYEIVLAAQKAAESQARPGASWAQLQRAAARTIAEGLARLGLIDSPTATYACAEAGGVCPQYRLFFMHGLGHGIGLDVHDPDAAIGFGAPFAVGSAFTIEPGIYVRADVLEHLPDTPENRALAQRLRPAVERYRTIGVRIEDDYFITEGGVERISAGAPREPDEVEALMRQATPLAAERRPEVVEWYRGVAPR